MSNGKLAKLRENEETSNAGKPWKDAENTLLMDRALNGRKIPELAKEHKRTVGGIRGQIIKNVARFIENKDYTREYLVQALDLTDEEIDRELAKQFQQKKKETTPEIIKEVRSMLQAVIYLQHRLIKMQPTNHQEGVPVIESMEKLVETIIEEMTNPVEPIPEQMMPIVQKEHSPRNWNV